MGHFRYAGRARNNERAENFENPFLGNGRPIARMFERDRKKREKQRRREQRRMKMDCAFDY